MIFKQESLMNPYVGGKNQSLPRNSVATVSKPDIKNEWTEHTRIQSIQEACN